MIVCLELYYCQIPFHCIVVCMYLMACVYHHRSWRSSLPLCITCLIGCTAGTFQNGISGHCSIWHGDYLSPCQKRMYCSPLIWPCKRSSWRHMSSRNANPRVIYVSVPHRHLTIREHRSLSLLMYNSVFVWYLFTQSRTISCSHCPLFLCLSKCTFLICWQASD